MVIVTVVMVTVVMVTVVMVILFLLSCCIATSVSHGSSWRWS